MAFGGETAESYYDEGLTASMRGDLELAIRNFEKAVELERGYFAAYHQLGKCYMRLGDLKKASKLLRQVIAVRPNLVPARIDLGYALIARGKTEEARRILQEVADARPDNYRAILGLAQCAFAEGQWDLAADLVQRSINTGGRNFAALFLLGRAARLSGRLEIALTALNAADKLLDQSIESNPNAPEGYFLRGEVYFALEDFTKALDAYRAAEDRAAPDRHYMAYGEHFSLLEILAKRGLCLQRTGRIDAAREIGEQILKVDPDHKLGQALRDL